MNYQGCNPKTFHKTRLLTRLHFQFEHSIFQFHLWPSMHKPLVSSYHFVPVEGLHLGHTMMHQPKLFFKIWIAQMSILDFDEFLL